MLYRHVSTRSWSSSIGSFNPTLSKGPSSTTWIWGLHATPHDFSISRSSSLDISRKVTSVSLAHLSIVVFWISGMLFHGAYFSNYLLWLRNPTGVKPSAQSVWSLVGQEILNGPLGDSSSGIYTTSGLFNLWRSQGMVSLYHLKLASLVALITSISLMWLSYYLMHISPLSSTPIRSFRTCLILGGLGSISWSGHLIHIAAPINLLLDSGADSSVICAPHALLSIEVISSLYPNFGSSCLPSHWISSLSTASNTAGILTSAAFSPTSLLNVASHHLYVGLVFIISGVFLRSNKSVRSTIGESLSSVFTAWNYQLSMSLLLFSSLSFSFAHLVSTAPSYAYLAADYPTLVSLYAHHMWIGGFLLIGSSSHFSIFMLSEYEPQRSFSSLISLLMAHRDSLIGHLSWVVVFLGLHGFGLYVHNDTMQALGRPCDLFSDSALQLKPLFASLGGFLVDPSSSEISIHVMGGKLLNSTSILGTSDFLVHHIHAFTIHTTALILLKSTLFSRSSRLVSDKHKLGFVYPCDGPGRGGTCQISPWDHVFLSIFWMYNCISVVLFHYFWKEQSDLWGSLSQTPNGGSVLHITSGDFSSNANTINGWLRSFLWSQSSQVIQAYSTSVSGYGFIFLGAHLLWAFSLMFLYSGRGYWQELIESILWSHHKLGFYPSIQPRALSISQGRSVGVTHYVLGGIGCTWSFFISRMVSLS